MNFIPKYPYESWDPPAGFSFHPAGRGVCGCCKKTGDLDLVSFDSHARKPNTVDDDCWEDILLCKICSQVVVPRVPPEELKELNKDSNGLISATLDENDCVHVFFKVLPTCEWLEISSWPRQSHN
jgi:hypothetical protein